MQFPDDEAMRRMMAEVHGMMGGAISAQRKLVEITGTAWSDDRLIKVVVGPRGQLVGLEIDPRVGNRLNTEALAGAILATAQTATEEAMAKAREIIDHDLPDTEEIRNTSVPGGIDITDIMTSTDADLLRIFDSDHDDDR